MAIEVILREHVDNLGQRGEVVKVAEGYARNFLLPRKLALRVTDENKRQIARERAAAEAREATDRREAEALAATLGRADVAIARRVGEHQTLYGSVTASDIAEALAAQQIVVDRRKLQLPEPLKTLGEHVVMVKLQRDVTAQIKVRVVPA